MGGGMDADSQVAALSKLISDEIIKAMGLSRQNPIGQILRPFFGRATRRFSRIFVDIDDRVAREGLASGARALLSHLVEGVEIMGADRVPPEGPLVIASNHPGTVDSLVITSAIQRPDLKIIASAVPFLRSLPNIGRSLIFTPPRDPHARMHVVRESLRHLEQGRALLLFGRGRIDPDPSFMFDSESLLDAWSRSLEIFLDRVPGARVLVTVVSGVLDPAFMRHPITLLRRAREDRQRLAMMMQVVQQMLGRRLGLRPRVTFGDLWSEESAGGREHVLPAVRQSARRLLERHARIAQPG